MKVGNDLNEYLFDLFTDSRYDSLVSLLNSFRDEYGRKVLSINVENEKDKVLYEKARYEGITWLILQLSIYKKRLIDNISKEENNVRPRK